MASVRWTLGASHEVRSIIDRHGIYSPTYAAAFSGRVRMSTQRLESFPYMGRMVPEFGEESLRELIIGDYRLVYELLDDDVVVMAVMHASQDMRTRPDRTRP